MREIVRQIVRRRGPYNEARQGHHRDRPRSGEMGWQLGPNLWRDRRDSSLRPKTSGRRWTKTWRKLRPRGSRIAIVRGYKFEIRAGAQANRSRAEWDKLISDFDAEELTIGEQLRQATLLAGPPHSGIDSRAAAPNSSLHLTRPSRFCLPRLGRRRLSGPYPRPDFRNRVGRAREHHVSGRVLPSGPDA